MRFRVSVIGSILAILITVGIVYLAAKDSQKYNTSATTVSDSAVTWIQSGPAPVIVSHTVDTAMPPSYDVIVVLRINLPVDIPKIRGSIDSLNAYARHHDIGTVEYVGEPAWGKQYHLHTSSEAGIQKYELRRRLSRLR